MNKQAVLEKNKATFDRLLYLLCPCEEGRRLGDALVRRYLDCVYRLPASGHHHHSEEGGLFSHSLEVAVKALAAFEAGYLGERRADGTLDNFSSHRHRPKWRFAVFVTALLHDAGKVFNVVVAEGSDVWSPLKESLAAFIERHPKATVTWRGDPVVSEKHATLNGLIAARVLTPEDLAYLEPRRFVPAMEALTADREISGNEVSRFIKPADRSSAREGLAAVREHADDKVAHFLRGLRALIQAGTLKVNTPQGQMYVNAERAALVVPSSLYPLRQFLHGEQVTLPENIALYNLLRDRGVAEANELGRVVKRLHVRVGDWQAASLTAIVLPTARLFSDDERSRLRTDVMFEESAEPSAPKDAASDETSPPARAGPPPDPPGVLTF